jgi:hypothetical protein
MRTGKLQGIATAARTARLQLFFSGLVLAFSPLHASDDLLLDDVEGAIQLLGDGFVIEAISAPDLTSPADWVGRGAGEYYFRYVSGNDHGKHEQVELHRPDPENPNLAWSRHIGDTIIEETTVIDGQGIRIHTETDIEHGYRVEIHPGISIPAGSKQGDTWTSDNTLTVFDLDAPDKIAYTGSMIAQRRYVGAYRVKVPAGLFDTILLEEDYKVRIGPLKGEDIRYVFYAKGVGVVAEVEGIRASALIVFRTKQKSAKVLERYPLQ